MLGKASSGGVGTPNSKLIPPTHVSVNRRVGASMATVMTDITTEDEGIRMGNPRHLAAIDTSRERPYEQDYDNMSWKGYIQEIEERDQDHKIEPRSSHFPLRSSPFNQLQVLEEVDIDNTPDLSQSQIEEEEDVKTVDEDIKEKTVISPDSKHLLKQPREMSCGIEDGTESPGEIGFGFKMGNFFGRRRHNHFSSEPSTPPGGRLRNDGGHRSKSQPSNLQFNTADNSYTRELEEEVIRLKLELAYAQTQSDQHQLTLHKLSEERNTLFSSNTELTLINNELAQTNATQMVQISGLQQHKDILTQKVDKLSQEFVKCTSELKTMGTENETLKKKANEQDVVIFYLQENIEKTSKEKDELRIANEQLTSLDNVNTSAMDWQHQSINESIGGNSSTKLSKPAHFIQIELNELKMKNKILQEENKQLKAFTQDSDVSTKKRQSTSLKSIDGNDRSGATMNKSNSYHTVISNTIQEVEDFCIGHHTALHNGMNTSTAIRRPDRSDMFDDNMYSYTASPASYMLPTSIDR